ncbi:unnamed protein product (macronuclear) [Paramecium tetraurelia]|uniref:Uncharacterized protein n=1 Tax=Paramecium tetraurelia TaxID=5888 RepID=A0DT81_PARTE|nr:uncharacterized protein GSPATT00019941001 [Paramecium tetraurelia]CAK86248.1 unnamed protein product [Paramecium tetraurelia]|eukprot:XP_001453645.1 hypothetical protein (macronuclear) [Paramecium tetraurelia strain d4-2]
MSYFFLLEDKQNEIIVGTLVFISICLFILLWFSKQSAKQRSIYEESYIKQSLLEFESNKQQLTKYHIEKLCENPKFKEWQSQPQNI